MGLAGGTMATSPDPSQPPPGLSSPCLGRSRVAGRRPVVWAGETVDSRGGSRLPLGKAEGQKNGRAQCQEMGAGGSQG